MTNETGVSSLKRNGLELFLLSLVSLYIELLIIRWMASDIQAFMVFTTFPLATCFVGLGVGFALGRDDVFRLTPVALLLFAITMKLSAFLGVGDLQFPTTSVYIWQNISDVSGNFWMYVLFFMLLLILLLAGPFALSVCIGARLGVLFNRMKPLTAYCINVGGAVVGSMSFAAVAFLGMPPWVWLIPATIILLWYCSADRPPFWKSFAKAVVPLVLSVAITSIPSPTEAVATPHWTPYQRIDLFPVNTFATVDGKKEPLNLGVVVSANHQFFQYALDLSPETMQRPGLKKEALDLLQEYKRRYSLPYMLSPAKEVLVVGSGLGNDVAEGLRQGATAVDAVEIDPVILKLAAKHNKAKPYESPNVRVICDDARHFFNHADKKYDLVVFSLLDSHAVSGNSASLRIDNYVYTRESFKRAFRLLKPDGLMVLTFASPSDWLSDRLLCTMKEAVGYTPLVIRDKDALTCPYTIFVVGRPVVDGTLPVNQLSKSFDVVATNANCQRVLTDDWPYLYLAPNAVDIPYLLVVAEIILLSIFASRRLLFAPADPRSWQMFFLGAAFLLLELQSIARLSLLYGTTWVTSSIVINGVLILILLANLLVIRFGERLHLTGRQNTLYGCLMMSLLISYLLPSDQVLAWNGGITEYFLVTLLTLLPMFIAAFIFATSFAQAANPARALAFNLLGSVAGAILEYLSNFWGISSLVLVAAALYGTSWYFCNRQTRSGSVSPL